MNKLEIAVEALRGIVAHDDNYGAICEPLRAIARTALAALEGEGAGEKADGGAAYVRELFGQDFTRLSVPGAGPDGLQRIEVDLKDGSPVSVCSSTIERAWERLADAARTLRSTPKEELDGLREAFVDVARKAIYRTAHNGPDHLCRLIADGCLAAITNRRASTQAAVPGVGELKTGADKAFDDLIRVAKRLRSRDLSAKDAPAMIEGYVGRLQAILALLSPSSGVGSEDLSTCSASGQVGEGDGERTAAVPADVARLVIAARVVAFQDLGSDAVDELDAASEAFASRVPWDAQPPEHPNGPGEREGGA